MTIEYGYPFTGEKLQQVCSFLKSGGLDYDRGIQFTVNFVKNGSIIATGSLQENIIKCLLVGNDYQGEGLSSALLTHLINQAFRQRRRHLFLFTSPNKEDLFTGQGFYPVARTRQTLLLENAKNGIRNFVKKLARPTEEGTIGCVVCNCNPLTDGHLFLIETAARQCDLLHVFILSEDKSVFPADDRYRLVKDGISSIRNAVVHPTSDYLISSATFPSYFIKDKSTVKDVNCELDFTIFYDYFVKELNISKRFVGSEPYSPVMSAYNAGMKAFFRTREVEIVEIPRCTFQGTAISASHVRALLSKGDYDSVRKIVPPVTYRFLFTPRGQEIVKRLIEEEYR
jgi:[citrate (pro-3S)-lyase] ligase